MKSLNHALLVTLAVSALVAHASGLPQSASAPAGAAPAKSKAGEQSKVLPGDLFHENWDSLTLQGSALQPQPPVLGERDDPPGGTFIRERFQMQWRPYDPLDLYVIRPKGVPKPPVILYLYSFPQDTDRFRDATWCAIATSGGYAAVGFVSAMTGHRSDVHPPKQWFVSELKESLVTSAHDVQMILNYLAERGDLDMDHVGMLGQGSGGTIAILASAADPRLKAVDVLSPWGDWPNWLAKSPVVPEAERPQYVTPEFLARVAPFDPVTRVPKMQAQRIRIQNVRKNLIMPDSSQEKIEAAAPDNAEINQFGDGAAFYPKAAGGALFDWLKAQINPDAAPVTTASKTDRVHFFPAMIKHETQPLP